MNPSSLGSRWFPAGLLALAPLSAGASTTILDFEGPSRGDYITTQFTVSHGVTITGFGGANWGARIFDTNIPTGNWVTANTAYDPNDPEFGDLDLGSPNEAAPVPGPGVGSGGAPGQPGENLVPLNNILVVDENGPDFPPDDQQIGGTIIATFSSPQRVVSVGLLSVDDLDIDLYFADPQAFVGINNISTDVNGYLELPINQNDVTEVWFKFNGGGGLAYIEYGPVPTPTTGAMALFGLGALALRRRRA